MATRGSEEIVDIKDGETIDFPEAEEGGGGGVLCNRLSISQTSLPLSGFFQTFNLIHSFELDQILFVYIDSPLQPLFLIVPYIIKSFNSKTTSRCRNLLYICLELV